MARFNLIVFTCGMAAFYLLLRNHVNRGVLRRFFLILIVGSMFPDHLKACYGEVFTAVLVGVGLTAAVYGRRMAGWVSVVIGVANTPATLLALGVALLLRIWRQRRLRWKSWLWVVYSLLVFGYLAYPLARSLLTDAWRSARSLRMPRLADAL